MSQQIVPVYRLHQSTMTSPCTFGDSCPTCNQHGRCRRGYRCVACHKGVKYVCERATCAEPAFHVTPAAAINMIRNGLARFVNHNTGIQLTFSHLVHLRGLSCNVDELVILLYAAGSLSARSAVDLGWGEPPAAIERSCPSTPVYPFV